MQTNQIELTTFGPEYLEAAIRLSRHAGWPHRLEDWQMALALSEGIVAVEDGRVVGTVLVTPYKRDCATINMVIVDEAVRGRGLGRKLMDAAFRIASDRPLRLVATAEGLPLYEKLGFGESDAVLHIRASSEKSPQRPNRRLRAPPMSKRSPNSTALPSAPTVER